MPQYLRSYQPGGTFFFTIVTQNRRPIFSNPNHIELLRDSLRTVKQERPFEFLAAVILPDHLHFLWSLPPTDTNFSSRIGRMKAIFSQSMRRVGTAHLPPQPLSSSRSRHHESGIWQRRFWEHTIRDEIDLENHYNYIHYNPVKHGLCTCPHAWPHSSFDHCVSTNIYAPDWCCSCNAEEAKPPYPHSTIQTAGE